MEEYVIKDTGAVLTDEMIEFLAAEAEEGYDLSRSEIVHIGRPPLEEGASESPRISYRAPLSIYKAAQRKAAAEGRTMSDVQRELLKNYVEG